MTKQEVINKFEECKENTEKIHEILKRVTIVKIFEHYETDKIIPTWYAANKWLVKIKRKNVYLFIFQAANNLMKIEAFKTKELPDLKEKASYYFDIEKFEINDYPDYMNADKLEDRINSLSLIL